MNKTRRKFLVGGAVASAGAVVYGAQHEHHDMPGMGAPAPASPTSERRPSRGRPGEALAARVVPVEGPDLQKLEHEMDGAVKVFRLRATVTKREFLPGRVVNVWGFNDQMPGPIIEATEGDRVRIVVENHLPEEFAPHWHGLEVPPEMDGVPGLNQDPIPPGGSFTYEFTLNQNGTYFYHSHMPMQEMMGMIGPFIIHPKVPHDPPVDRDFVLVWQEWAILPNNDTPNTLSMEFNWLTMNGKAGPDATPMLAKHGERVRVRLINLGMDHHPIHLHGNQFVITGTEAGRKPEATWFKENTVILGVAQARDFEFDAKHVGNWMVHCHLPHHMMNAMASMVGPMMGIGRGIAGVGSQENGMGMLTGGGNALSDDYGPKLGRTLAVGAGESQVTNLPVTPEGEKAAGMAGMPGMGGQQAAPSSGGSMAGMDHSKMHHGMAGMGGGQQPGPTTNPTDVPRQPASTGPRGDAPGAPKQNGLVPGYPQDMAMEMDEMVAKPETYGLRPTWTIGMMGMMTMVRVLEPSMYDEIQRLKANWTPPTRPEQPMGHDHTKMHHGGAPSAPTESAPMDHDHMTMQQEPSAPPKP